MLKDIKYIAAYTVPLSAWWAITQGGPWSWTTVVMVFGILPLVEAILPQSAQNFGEEEEANYNKRRFFDFLLYLNLPLVYGTILWAAYVVANRPMTAIELLGLVLSVGTVLGTNGINVAHELGHRPEKGHQLLSKLLLLPELYMHFFIEHNKGHHKHVATEADPATSRLGQNVYHFWWQSVTGSWLDAWKIEGERLRRDGRAFWSLHNEMLVYQIIQLGWIALFFVVFDAKAGIFAIVAAIVGFLLLETVNYIEHYGLRRQLLPSGRYEPVLPIHSWNSDHELGRIFLYELTRHSDHHYKSTRKYQVLRHMDESPQLPLGYPGSMLLSLVPPAWFALMDKRAARANAAQVVAS
jgi:alkane 1-monooxygenase